MKQLSPEIKVALNSIPYEYLRDAVIYLDDRKRDEYSAWYQKMLVKWSEDARKRQLAANRFKTNIVPTIRSFLQSVAPGTLLKLKGCRDGHGIRYFMNYDAKNRYIECRQVTLYKNPQDYDLGQITTHMDDKLQSWFNNDTGKWEKFTLDKNNLIK